MAMRGRGGRANPNRPPLLITGQVYEQFKPMSEWRQEDGYDTLLLYLPGFQKEYIKVTNENVNSIRVRGERLIVHNKWNRFQEDYRVPEHCEMRGIRAKFDDDILTITMPRKTTTLPPPPPPTTTTQLPPKTIEQPNIKEEPKEKKPDKPPTTPLEGYTLPLQPKPTSSSTRQEPLKPTPDPKEVLQSTIGSMPQHTPKIDKHNVAGENTYLVNEDRKALVNVGVGVLVIVALAVHVSYTLTNTK